MSTLDDLLQQSLRFEYQTGNIAYLRHPHTTGWRTLPCLMLSQAHTGRERMHLRDAKALETRPGEIMLLPAGVLHKVDVATPHETRRWAHINYFVLNGVDLFSLLDIPPKLARAPGIAIGDAIEAWLEEESRADRAKPVLLNARRQEFGFRLLSMLAPFCKLKPGAQKTLERARDLQPVIDHMQRHLDQELMRDDLAKLASLSPAQFHCVFKAATGASPMDYLRRLRMRRAQQQLMLTNLQVGDIAAACGYADPFVFSKAFKREVGQSPQSYRQSMQVLRGGAVR